MKLDNCKSNHMWKRSQIKYQTQIHCSCMRWDRQSQETTASGDYAPSLIILIYLLIQAWRKDATALRQME